MPLKRPPVYTPTIDQIMDRLLGNLKFKTRKYISSILDKDKLTEIYDSLKATGHWKMEVIDNSDPNNKKAFILELFPAPEPYKNITIAVEKLVGDYNAKEVIELGHWLPAACHIAKHLGKKVVGIVSLGTVNSKYRVVDENPDFSTFAPLFEFVFKNQYIFSAVSLLKPDTNEPLYYPSQENIDKVQEFRLLYQSIDTSIRKFNKSMGLYIFSNVLDCIDAFVTYYFKITGNRLSDTLSLGKLNVDLLYYPVVQKELSRVWEILDITPEQFKEHYTNIHKILGNV